MELLLLFIFMTCCFVHIQKPPNFKYRCIIGIHSYSYAGRKSGMTFNPHGRGVSGTECSIYKCSSCGKYKPAENDDYD